MVLAPDPKTAFDDLDVIARECGIDIAAHHGRFPSDVVAACAAFEHHLVVFPIWMNQRRVWRQRLGHCDDGGEGLQFDRDRGRSGFCLRLRISGDRRDRLAVVPDAVDGKERMISDADAVAERRIRPRNDRAYARHPSRSRCVDAHDTSGRNLCSRHRRVQHAGATAIDRVTGAAAQLVASVAPREVHDSGCRFGHPFHRGSARSTSESAASRMRSDPVQRQTFPTSAAFMSVRLGCSACSK
jgi:hypothetical protein